MDVTVVVVPRERFSATERSLTNLFANTPPVRLIYVSAGAPSSVQRYLEAASGKMQFRLITTGYLSPNQARNVALREVSTKYVVFVDNDALVTPGWLERLVRCAEDTGAAIVGPLYLIGEIEQKRIHMAGGTLHFKEIDGRKIAYDEHRLVDVHLDALSAPLKRSECDFVEFHCMLGRTAFLKDLGELDEGLLSLHEHIDVGWAARAAGGAVFVEPAAVVTYLPPPPFEWSDLPYFMLRWCDDWSTVSLERFRQKWGVAATRHFGDEDASPEREDTGVGFARAHRRRAAGLQIGGGANGKFESANDQASLMVALFQSVDRDRFDLALTGADALEVDARAGLTSHATLELLPAFLRRGETERLNVLLRPSAPRRAVDPALIRVELDLEQLSDVEPYAFLVVEGGADRHDAWLAMDTVTRQSAALLRRIRAAGVPGGAASFCRIAGSLEFQTEADAAGPARVGLLKGVAGRVTTAMELDGCAALPHLWSSEIY